MGSRRDVVRILGLLSPHQTKPRFLTMETLFTRCCLGLFAVGCVGLLVNVAGQSLSETPNQNSGTQAHRIAGWNQ